MVTVRPQESKNFSGSLRLRLNLLFHTRDAFGVTGFRGTVAVVGVVGQVEVVLVGDVVDVLVLWVFLERRAEDRRGRAVGVITLV